jgi:hypothetical protein
LVLLRTRASCILFQVFIDHVKRYFAASQENGRDECHMILS